jgi:hypothetical protein
MIWLINSEGISPTDGPNIFMAGLIPPSIATLFLYAKVFGRHLIPQVKSSRTANERHKRDGFGR